MWGAGMGATTTTRQTRKTKPLQARTTEIPTTRADETMKQDTSMQRTAKVPGGSGSQRHQGGVRGRHGKPRLRGRFLWEELLLHLGLLVHLVPGVVGHGAATGCGPGSVDHAHCCCQVLGADMHGVGDGHARGSLRSRESKKKKAQRDECETNGSDLTLTLW